MRLQIHLLWALGLLLGFGGGSAPAHGAEQVFPQAAPEDLGLVLPQAPPRPGEGRRVLVPVDDQQPVVGLVHVQVGDHYVVMLPNGRLISLPVAKTTPTDRPFQAATKEEMTAELLEGPFRGFRTRTTRRYLYVYNTSEEFATATSRILETMYPGLSSYCRKQGLEVHDPPFPLVVIMFQTEEEFQRYREMPAGLVAYYNGISNRVVMYEQSRLTRVAPMLAFKQAVSTIAHEGVHQILHNIGVQQRLARWPLWLSEGLAEYFAPTEVGRRIRWKGVGLVHDLRMHELSEFYKQRDGQSTSGQFFRQTTQATRLNSLGYAASWALVSYLAKHERAKFADYVQDASRLRPLESVDSGSLFARHFGVDYDQLETRLIRYLHSLPYVDPIVNQPHYVLMIQDRGGRQVTVTPSPAEVQKRAQGQVFQVRAFPNRRLAEQFARVWLQGR